jgi:hypothetical protein
MNNEWEDMLNYISCPVMESGKNYSFGVHEGYEYKVMRRKLKTERERFIEQSASLCFGTGTLRATFGSLYDAGARFK